jgi:hypothetical protein
MQRTPNIFDKIGSFIPGYAGYAERERTRQSDKLLREKIVIILTASESIITQRITSEVRKNNYDIISDYEESKKRLNTLSNKIKYATYGESAFFSSNQLKEDELLQIYQRDFGLLEKANYLKQTISKLDIPSISQSIDEIEGMFNDRNEFIKEFK